MTQTSRQSPEDLIAFAPNHEVFSLQLNAGDPVTDAPNNKYSQFEAKLTREEFDKVVELISTFEKKIVLVGNFVFRDDRN